MTQPQELSPYMGFTANEVKAICENRKLNYTGFRKWYDGYKLSNKISKEMLLGDVYNDHLWNCEYDIYSPYSVVNAALSRQFANYWNQTETYEALRQYIEWNFDGLKEDIAILMNGGRIKADVAGYQNDLTTFHNKDDILTLLIHLGYLGYDREDEEVFIPNREVRQVFETSTKTENWSVTLRALDNSRRLLKATLACDEETVAELIEAAHDKAGNKTYHTEAGLSYAVQLAYYSAQEWYTLIPEVDTGKGFADLIYLPKIPDKPAILVEFKLDEDAETAINQIHRQRYPDRLEHYKGNLILVGISYEKTVSNQSTLFKHHSCKIERA